MNVFERFLRFFAKKKSVDEWSDESVSQECKVGEVNYLLKMSYNVVHPADMLQSLCMAVVINTQKVASVCVRDIRLYSVYDLEDDSFLGSFYAVKRDGVYYGNIVGSAQIVACKSGAFRLKETNELFVPLRNDGKNLFVLMCLYEYKTAVLTVNCLKKFDLEMKNGEILQSFTGMSFEQAFELSQNLINS